MDTEGYSVDVLVLFESIPRTNIYSVAIGIGAIVIIRLLKRYVPKLPGALIPLMLLTSVVAACNLKDTGVGVLGAIPSGPPTISVGLAITEIGHFGASSKQAARCLRAILEHLPNVLPEAHQVALRQKLDSLERAKQRAFPDEEDRSRYQVGDLQGMGGSQSS